MLLLLLLGRPPVWGWLLLLLLLLLYVLIMRVLTRRTPVRVETAILILRKVTLASRVAVGKLRRVGRGSAGWEDVVVCIIVLLVCATCATALTRKGRGNVGHLMSLVEHHLLISPLGELSICWIKVRILLVNLALLWMRMKRETGLVRVLVKGLVKVLLLLLMGGVPTCLLLLYGVRIRLLLRNWRCGGGLFV